MSYFVEKVNEWRKAYGRQMSVIETVALYGCDWVVMCDDDPFLHVWRNACVMMGWSEEETSSTAKEAWLRYSEVMDR